MTCFSIQKKIYLILLTIAALGLCSPFSNAQDTDLKKKILDAEQQINSDKDKYNREKIFAATDAPIVIELFTAPDCSACVYADRMLYDAMKNENVIGLSCYIKDKANYDGEVNYRTLNPETPGPIDACVFRQWTYLTGTRLLSSYLNTPEFVIAGNEKLSSGNLSLFEASIKEKTMGVYNKTLKVPMTWLDKNNLAIQLPYQEPDSGTTINASVWLIRYKDMMIEKVDNGPNAGKVLRFSNIIQNSQHIAKWYGNERTLKVKVNNSPNEEDRGGYVVLIQEMLGEKILAAGKISDANGVNNSR